MADFVDYMEKVCREFGIRIKVEDDLQYLVDERFLGCRPVGNHCRVKLLCVKRMRLQKAAVRLPGASCTSFRLKE